MRSYECQFTGRDFARCVLPTLAVLGCLALAVHAAGRLGVLPPPPAGWNPDLATFIHQSGACRSRTPAEIVLVGDSTCVVGVDAPDRSRQLPRRPSVRNLALVVWIGLELYAEVKDCQGRIVAPNQVLYEGAFEGDLQASIRYTYTNDIYAQDVIISPSQIIDPQSYGLSEASTVLQVLTEFVASPAPKRATRAVRLESGAQVQDDDLDWGAVKLGRGKAFSIGQTAADADVPVVRQWLKLEGRDFLIEQVPVAV